MFAKTEYDLVVTPYDKIALWKKIYYSLYVTVIMVILSIGLTNATVFLVQRLNANF